MNTNLVQQIDALVREMIEYRKSTGVDSILLKCRKYAKGEVDCAEDATEYEKQMQRAADGIIPRKIDDLHSWMFDIISNSFDSLFTIEPTAVVDLPRSKKDKVLDTLEKTLYTLVVQRRTETLSLIAQEAAAQGVQITEEQAISIAESRGINLVPSQQGVTEIARQLKSVAMKFENDLAKDGALKMKNEIQDIIDETDFVDELLRWLRDYCEFPYAVLRSIVVMEKRFVWKGNRRTQIDVETPMIKRVSPFDFFWSPDSTTTQDGTAVAERMRLLKNEFRKMGQVEGQGYNKQGIDKFLKEMEFGHRDWLVEHEMDEEDDSSTVWSSTETVDVYRYSGLIAGKKLIEWKYQEHDALLLDIDSVLPGIQYEVECLYAANTVMQLIIRQPDCQPRSYHAEKYLTVNGQFHGQSLCEILEPIELKIRATDRHLITNMAYANDPLVIVDEEQLADNHGLPLGERLMPGTIIPIKTIPGASQRAVNIVKYPDNVQQLRQMKGDLIESADIASGIPRFAVGDTSNLNSALRSANLVTLMLSNARRTLKVRLLRISRNVIVPSLRTFFEWYMENGENEDAKVDSDVNIGSIDAILNKDFVVPQIQSIIQYLGQFADSDVLPDNTIRNLIEKLLFELGIDDGVDDERASEAIGGAIDTLLLSNPENPLPPQLDQRSAIDVPQV